MRPPSCILASLLAVAVAAPLSGQPSIDSTIVSVTGHGGTTYVLISGIVGGVAGFRRLQTRLVAEGARVIVVDPYRLSIKASDVSFTAIARRLDTLLARYGVDSARVVAHAHGGGVALRLAANTPHRVAALYFLDVGALDSNRTKVLSTSLRLAPYIVHIPGGRGYLRRHFLRGLRQHSGCHDWLDSTTQRAYAEPMLDHIGEAVGMAVRLARAKEPEPVNALIMRLRIPVTLILGEAPHASAPDAAELSRLEPLGPRLRVARLAAVGHFPHEEATDEVARIVLTMPLVDAQTATRSRPTGAAGTHCALPAR